MGSKCNKNNCGCHSEVTKICNTCKPVESCDCPISDLSSNCILYAGDDLECSGIEEGTILTDVIQKLDAFICEKFGSITNFFNLVNVGVGAEIYKGIDGLGRKEIRSLLGDGIITVTEDTNTITISAEPAEFEQNNIVKQILIDKNTLEVDDYYDINSIIDYILNLPEEERTIEETTSKVNIIIYQAGEGGIRAYETYELQNIGKGLITELLPENLLRFANDELQTFQDVLARGTTLTSSHSVSIEGEKFEMIVGDSGGNLILANPSLEPDFPNALIGRGYGNISTENSLSFYSNRTVFLDSVNSRGIEYAGDYEANFTNRTFITKQYADSLAVAGTAEAKKEYIVIPLSDLTTNLTTGVTKAYFRMPFAGIVNSVRASVLVVQTAGSVLTFDINENGTSILSTKLTIDNNEKTSLTATVPAVVSDTSLADDAEITFDIDQVGTAGAKGAVITLLVTRV